MSVSESNQQPSKRRKDGTQSTNTSYRRITSMQLLRAQEEELSNNLIDEHNCVESRNRNNNSDRNDDNQVMDEDEYKSIQQVAIVNSLSTTSFSSESSSDNNSNNSLNQNEENKMLLFNPKHEKQKIKKIDSINDLFNLLSINNKNIHQNNPQNLTKAERRALRQLLHQKKQKEAEEELANRALKRSMTSNQELWNAITMLPVLSYHLYHLFNSKSWLPPLSIQHSSSTFDEWSSTFDSSSYCMTNIVWSPLHAILPHFYAMPPFTLLALNVACILHSPVSIYYHILCAYKLPPGPKRMDHWARRLDQAMIHMMSFMFAYGTSANTDYFLITLAFNIDCMYRLFQKGMRPKQTMYRMIAGFIIPVLPFVTRGDWVNLVLLLFIYGISGWLFSSYPCGGWSHGAFHLVAFLSSPILVKASLNMNVDFVRDAVDVASKCLVLTKNNGGL